MILLEFYTTSGCHLCEQGERLFAPFLQQNLISVTNIDIADDDRLVDKYGIRIPVYRRIDTGTELGWPFDEDTINAFLIN